MVRYLDLLADKDVARECIKVPTVNLCHVPQKNVDPISNCKYYAISKCTLNNVLSFA